VPGRGAPAGPPLPTPYDDHPGTPPYVYNPYGNVTYPATYPTPPAGLGPDDAAGPARRPRWATLGLVLLVVSTLPYLLIGFLAVAAAGSVEAAVPPEQLAQLQQAGVDLEQVVRTTGVILLIVGLLFVALAVLSWSGRRWARALLTAMTVGFALMVAASVVAAWSNLDLGGLVLIGVPLLLAVVGVRLMFGRAADAWFGRPRR
jgi:hypothetical protein